MITLTPWFRSNDQDIQIEKITLAERARARRTRRLNLKIYFGIWLAFFCYAAFSFFSLDTIYAALDRFISLQFVAGIAALAVFLGGRTFSSRSRFRKISIVPIGVTVCGLFLTVSVLLFMNWPQDIVHNPAVAPAQTTNIPQVIFVSL